MPGVCCYEYGQRGRSLFLFLLLLTVIDIENGFSLYSLDAKRWKRKESQQYSVSVLHILPVY